MFRNKRFLTGLGAGLMIGAILLQLMNAAVSGDERVADPGNLPGAPDSGDIDSLRDAAERLGMVVLDADKEWYSREQVDELVEEALANRAGEKADAAAGPEPNGVATDPLPHFYLVEIRSGMSSDEVGKMLNAAGLVEDLDAYREEMATRGLTVKIRAGTYTFAYKPDLAALIDAITLDSDNRRESGQP